jgi:hypothetical protein
LVLLAALAVWGPKQLSLQMSRQALADATRRLAGLQERLATAGTALASAQETLRQEAASRNRALAAAIRVERALRDADPESQ